MKINLQPFLQNQLIRIEPLKANDFEKLFKVASDRDIWLQHPNPDRYKEDVFKVFFEGALISKSAFLVYELKNNALIGSSRFYDLDTSKKCITIGYTFLAKEFWGHTYNKALKSLMLNYAFTFSDSVLFYIGANNLRSQIAINKIGAKKIDEIALSYYGEAPALNFIFEIKKSEWLP